LTRQIASGHAASTATESLVRVGFVARGAVYLVVGWLALQTAVGIGNAGIADKQKALQTVGAEPFGTFLLVLVAAGLLAYAVWSLVRALADPERRGHDAGAVFARIGNAVAAISYGSLGIGAARLALGLGSVGKGSDESTQDQTARLLEVPFGPPLVIGLGLVVVAVGAIEMGRAYKASFQDDLRTGSLKGAERTWLIRFGRLGFAARGVVFAFIGVFLIQAARHDDPSQAVGLGGALQKLSEQSFGPLLLALVALGLCMYGLFSLAEAKYRRLEGISRSRNARS
jgi:hypothetical protein